MKNINIYITEKLYLNKDININNKVNRDIDYDILKLLDLDNNDDAKNSLYDFLTEHNYADAYNIIMYASKHDFKNLENTSDKLLLKSYMENGSIEKNIDKELSKRPDPNDHVEYIDVFEDDDTLIVGGIKDFNISKTISIVIVDSKFEKPIYIVFMVSNEKYK